MQFCVRHMLGLLEHFRSDRGNALRSCWFPIANAKPLGTFAGIALAAILLTLIAAAPSFAIEPIKISSGDVALDLSGAVEIYRNQGENFQVSTAPGPDGIVRRIEVEANDAKSRGDWGVVALANTTDQQIDRLIVAPHFRLVNSGIFWPDLGSSRITAITPSEGFALDRQVSPDADVFRVTLNPGAVVTFIAELSSPKLPQVYLWEPEAYKDSVNSYTLFRGIVIGISGLLALFMTILFVVKGTSMFPATAALSWAVLAYICVDFGFVNEVIDITPGSQQIWRAGTEVALAATFVVFLFAYLNLNRWHNHFSYLALLWMAGLAGIAGVAVIDPSVAAGIARISFAATAVVGLFLIIMLGFRGYDRAIMLVPSWVMVLAWLTASWMAITGILNNDIIQPALGGGLILIILLIGFTVIQHAFAGGALHQGLFSDLERQALAVAGSGDIVWDWDVLRDRVTTRPDVSAQLGLPPNSLGGPARNWLPVLHADDRDSFRTTLDVVLEHRRGRVMQNFRLRGADGHYHWFSLKARKIAAKVMAGKIARRSSASPSSPTRSTRQREGSRLPVQQVPRRRRDPRPGDAQHRRGDGHRRELRDGVRQEPDRGRHGAADEGHGVHQRPRRGQARRSSRSRRRWPSAASSIIATRRHVRRAARSTTSRPRGSASSSEGRPNIKDFIKNGQVQLIINTPTKKGPQTDEGKIRAMAVLNKVPIVTTITGANAAAQGDPGDAEGATGACGRCRSTVTWRDVTKAPRPTSKPDRRSRSDAPLTVTRLAVFVLCTLAKRLNLDSTSARATALSAAASAGRPGCFSGTGPARSTPAATGRTGRAPGRGRAGGARARARGAFPFPARPRRRRSGRCCRRRSAGSGACASASDGLTRAGAALRDHSTSGAEHFLHAAVGFVGRERCARRRTGRRASCAVDVDADEEVSRQPDAPGAQAQPLGDDLVDQAQRDRQAALRLQDGGQVAVGGVVVVSGVADEAFFFEQHIVQVGQQRLRLAAADARADRVGVAWSVASTSAGSTSSIWCIAMAIAPCSRASGESISRPAGSAA